MRQVTIGILVTTLAWVGAVSPRLQADQQERSSIADMQEKALRFLDARQRDDGSWTRADAIGFTGLITTAMLRSGRSPDDPTVASALKHLEDNVQADGGVYAAGSLYRNYETSIAVMAFAEAGADGRYDAVLDRAREFLIGLQWDKGEGIESGDPAWGGGGYGKHQRPDLCNSEFLIEALRKAGVKDYDPAMENVRIFVSRCQNLDSSHNTTEFADKVNDGGFYYTAAAGGDSKAGTTENGGLRSYGSMTYAGLKSLIYTGLSHDDSRVEAATDWIRNNYTLDENPGMGRQGVYYYYHTFAKTMQLLAEDEFVDSEGTKHNWREELIDRLHSLQQPNGSWINPRAPRWEEGDPHLVTAYCLLALSHCDAPR